MLSIAVDCRKINDGGIGTYLRNLLIHWHRAGMPARFFLFGKTADLENLNLPEDFAEIIAFDYPKYSISEMLAFKTPLLKLKTDLFFTPHYTLPFNIPCPSIVTIHDLIHLKLPVKFGYLGRTYARSIVGHACRKSHTILTDSQHSKNDISAAFPESSGKVRIVYPGVDMAIFKKYPDDRLSQFRIDKGMPRDFVLYVGALKKHKNPKALVEIVNKLKSPMIIASGDRDAYERHVRAYVDDGELLRLVEVKDELELALLYNSARVFIFPSLYEGFGLPPLEAMACGTPVVCSNRTSLPEVVDDAALLFSPDNIPDMLARVEECWHNGQTRIRLSREGVARASMFSWERTAADIFGIFQKAVSRW